MMKSLGALSVLAALGLITGLQADQQCQTCPVSAAASSQCASECSKTAGQCEKAECSKTAGQCAKAGGGCPITAAMAKLPQITYAVGDQTTCCPDAAAEIAKQSDKPIQYVVGEKKFASQAEAKAALADATEQFVAAFVEPKTCAVSGTTTVAGQKLSCEKTAAKRAETAKAAIEKVQLTYVVGEKSCQCPVEAKKLAQESGQGTVYAVGETKTKCSVEARLNLARAKYKAAVEALVKAEAADSNTSGS